MISEFVIWAISNPSHFFVLLFIEYVVLFEIYAYTTNTIFEKPFKYIAGYLIFAPQDWLMNIILIFLFFDAPGSSLELVTGRMKRYKKTYTYSLYDDYSFLEKFRLNFAWILCNHLNKYDKDHC